MADYVSYKTFHASIVPEVSLRVWYVFGSIRKQFVVSVMEPLPIVAIAHSLGVVQVPVVVVPLPSFILGFYENKVVLI